MFLFRFRCSRCRSSSNLITLDFSISRVAMFRNTTCRFFLDAWLKAPLDLTLDNLSRFAGTLRRIIQGGIGSGSIEYVLSSLLTFKSLIEGLQNLALLGRREHVCTKNRDDLVGHVGGGYEDECDGNFPLRPSGQTSANQEGGCYNVLGGYDLLDCWDVQGEMSCLLASGGRADELISKM